jgi:hypothetical protein
MGIRKSEIRGILEEAITVVIYLVLFFVIAVIIME